LVIVLVTLAICAEWSLQMKAADMAAFSEVDRWAALSGVAWGFAIWVSAYEPLVLFFVVTAATAVVNRRALFARDRRTTWIVLAAVIALGLLVERRLPSLAIVQSNVVFKNWAGTIGELGQVLPANPVWLRWCGYLILIAPFLIWMCVRNRNGGRTTPVFVLVLLVATYSLTIWQARWGYFFVLIFAFALPGLLAPIKSGVAVWIAFFLSIFPVLHDWDEKLWPNDAQFASRMERRIESAQIRDLALSLRSADAHPFLAPWWLSPSITYWSGQPGIAGSSHESLNGIEDSARFFLSDDLQRAREILQTHRVAWVCSYDSDRVAQNSAGILN